jgi:hypothetical protein
MPAGRRLLAAILAGLLCCGAAAGPLDVIDACIAAGPAGTRGITALEAECSGLEAALREAGLDEVLTDDWHESLSRSGLRDLLALGQRYREAPASSAPDTGALPSILQQLASEQDAPSTSWWARFTDWLRSLAIREADDSSPWFQRVLERLVESIDLIQLITYVLLTLMVIGVIGIFVNELRVAGVLSRRGKGRTTADGVSVEDEGAQSDSVDLDALAVHEQPSALLRQLVTRLRAVGQLGAERSLTHRELVARCAFTDAQSRRRFENVATLAERILYGHDEVSGRETAAVIADGRALLLQLPAPAMEKN